METSAKLATLLAFFALGAVSVTARAQEGDAPAAGPAKTGADMKQAAEALEKAARNAQSGAVPAKKPEAAAPARKAPSRDEVDVAQTAAAFFDALLAGHADQVAALCNPTFSFDGKPASGSDDVKKRFADIMASRDIGRYTLIDVKILSAAEAIEKHGKPPRRIAPLVQPGTWVAVADLSGRATIVVFARGGSGWQAVGLHD